ncbi:MAG: hypothetical protein ACREYF_02750 [Gammaproteobacteria bacterium]
MTTIPLNRRKFAVRLRANDVVLAEAVWTLQSAYRWNKPEIVAVLRVLAATSTFAFENRDTSHRLV